MARDTLPAGFVAGRPVDSRSGDSLDVVDPWDGTTVATVGVAGAGEVDDAVAAAAKAFYDAPQKIRSLVGSGWLHLQANAL